MLSVFQNFHIQSFSSIQIITIGNFLVELLKMVLSQVYVFTLGFQCV